GIAFSSDVQAGGGTLTLGGNVTVNANSGTLASSPGAIINGNLNLGTGVARTVTVQDSATASDLTITGTVSGTPTSTQITGPGRILLMGAGTFTGPVTIGTAATT